MRLAKRRPDQGAAPVSGLRTDGPADASANLFHREMGRFETIQFGRLLDFGARIDIGQRPLLLPSSESAPVPALVAANPPAAAVAPAATGDSGTVELSAPTPPDRPAAASAPAAAGDDDSAKGNRTGGILQAPAAPTFERPLSVATNGGTAILSEAAGHWFVDAGLGADIRVALTTSPATSVITVDLAGAPAAGDSLADTLTVSATNGVNAITITGAATSYSLSGLSAVVNVVGSEGAFDFLVVNGLGGNDTITATALPAGVTRLTLDGGAGDDTLFGSLGADVLIGGTENDFVLGDNGNDTAFLGAGDDVFQWDPGDGSDVVEGQAGTDRLVFSGANIAENIAVSANGARVLFTRDVANIVMDLDDVEELRFNALGGTDTIVVGDMTGTDLTRVELNLASGLGGGDGVVDNVAVTGTAGDDVVAVALGSGGISVTGLPANTILLAADSTDRLTFNALGGDDVIDATALPAGNLLLTFNGGLGADVFLGSPGDDLFNGGDGDDTALMGAGNDTFVWNPGDDNDIIEGQAGTADTLVFNGAGVAETITMSANGGRVLFFRNVASVTMDLNDTEVVEFNALGGADSITVNDLTGTDVTTVRINLAGVGGGGDGAVDTITIIGTAGADSLTLTNTGSSVTITGLPYQILITGFEAGDRIIINTLGGDDTVNGSALDATVAFTADGGDNNDTLIGGAAADTLFGGNGNDFLQGNGGVDTLDGGAGTNTVIQ